MSAFYTYYASKGRITLRTQLWRVVEPHDGVPSKATADDAAVPRTILSSARSCCEPRRRSRLIFSSSLRLFASCSPRSNIVDLSFLQKRLLPFRRILLPSCLSDLCTLSPSSSPPLPFFPFPYRSLQIASSIRQFRLSSLPLMSSLF